MMYYSRKKEIINSCVEIFILAFVLIVNLRSIIKKRIKKYNKSNIDSDSLMVLGTGPSISKTMTKLAQRSNKYKYIAVNNFINSEGCILNTNNEIQRLLPFTTWPIPGMRTRISETMPAINK